MTKVDELFLKLGYELTIYGKPYAVEEVSRVSYIYRKTIDEDFKLYKVIDIVVFDNKNFEILCEINRNADTINKDEFNAINQKLKELNLTD